MLGIKWIAIVSGGNRVISAVRGRVLISALLLAKLSLNTKYRAIPLVVLQIPAVLVMAAWWDWLPSLCFIFQRSIGILHFSGESSRTIHGAVECIEASRLFGEILFRTLSGANKIEILLKHNTNTQNPDRAHGGSNGKTDRYSFPQKVKIHRFSFIKISSKFHQNS